MTNQQIFEKLSLIVKGINPEVTISENSGLTGESILDSLEFMNYITKVEELFSLTISNDEISGLQLGVIQNMIKFIKSKIH